MLLDFSRASGTPNKVIPKLTKPRPPWFTANWPEGCKHLCLIVSKERYVNPSNYCLSLLSLSPGLPCRVFVLSCSELFSELFSELLSELFSELLSELFSELLSEMFSELFSDLFTELFSELFFLSCSLSCLQSCFQSCSQLS